MATTRPYYLVYKGEEFIIEATGAAEAVRHVVDQDITELRSARASEVSAWTRAGKPIPLAGQKPVATQAESASDSEVDSDNGKLLAAWLLNRQAKPRTEEGTRTLVNGAAEVIRGGKMTLANFDEIRGFCPEFADAIVWIIQEGVEPEPGSALPQYDVDMIRGELEEKPFPIDVVVAALAYPYRNQAADAE